MRKIDVSKIKDAVRDLCLKANFELRRDVLAALRSGLRKETDVRARKILKSIIENSSVAKKKRIAICQDTGVVFVHLDIGQGVALKGGDLAKAVDGGVEEAYRKGYLRKSVVGDPFTRGNTGSNTPSVIAVDIVKGDGIKISVSPKGFGSENRSAIRMFNPTSSIEDIKKFILEAVRNAGPGACPPLVLGIGIGGTFDSCARLAKMALMRPIGIRNGKGHIASLERELMKDINSTGIGPMGLGGRTTVLGVNIMEAPTHIAGLPVAINVSCHATRSAEKVI